MPHEKGLLRKKREELEALAAISARPDPELVRLIEEGNLDAVTAHYQVIRHWVDVTLLRTLQICVGTIQRQETWAKLSGDPAEFNAFLDKILKGTERCLKLIHNIPDHRPTTQALRDQRIEELQREFPEATWGQIAIKYNARFTEATADQIDAKSAHQAVKRLQNRRSKYERDIVSRAINAAETSLQTASLSDEEVLPLLPKPEDVLKLLISDK